MVSIIVFWTLYTCGYNYNNYHSYYSILVKKHKIEQDVLIEKDVVQKESKAEIKLILEPIVFQGDLENQIYSLCNKTVKEGHVILICPKCTSLFHHNHLLDWLKDNPVCPVCNIQIKL
ncbi:MAG: hypothetical protein GNW80_03850 [Asgard group archaeon]|nr:hypothetical protein [Asgard group archaeon]